MRDRVLNPEIPLLGSRACQLGLMELIVSADVAVRGTKFGKTSLDGGLNGFCSVARAFRPDVRLPREEWRIHDQLDKRR